MPQKPEILDIIDRPSRDNTSTIFVGDVGQWQTNWSKVAGLEGGSAADYAKE